MFLNYFKFEIEKRGCNVFESDTPKGSRTASYVLDRTCYYKSPEDGQSILFRNVESKPVLFRTAHSQERVVLHGVTAIYVYHSSSTMKTFKSYSVS